MYNNDKEDQSAIVTHPSQSYYPMRNRQNALLEVIHKNEVKRVKNMPRQL